MQEDPKVIEAAWAATTLAAGLPQVVQELDQMMEQRLAISLHSLARDELTPEMALTTLIVIKTMRDLKQRLLARVKGVTYD